MMFFSILCRRFSNFTKDEHSSSVFIESNIMLASLGHLMSIFRVSKSKTKNDTTLCWGSDTDCRFRYYYLGAHVAQLDRVLVSLLSEFQYLHGAEPFSVKDTASTFRNLISFSHLE